MRPWVQSSETQNEEKEKQKEYPCYTHDGGARAQRATIGTEHRVCLNCELDANEEAE